MTLLGYARVSTEDQPTDPQLDALRAAGCARISQGALALTAAQSLCIRNLFNKLEITPP